MNNFIITNKGKTLISQLIAGTSTATFTKVETSDRDYSAANLSELEELKDVKQSVPVSKIAQKSDTLVEVLAAFENTEVTVGYYVRAVGLYAKDAEDNEILYAVATDDNPDYIPAYSEKTVSGVSYRFNIKVGNASYITIEVNPAVAVTQEQFRDLEKKVDTMQTVDVDFELSDTSENPVQNKVIRAALDKKVDKVEGKALSSNDFSDEYKQKVEDSESHMDEMVYGENGAHGIRYFNGRIQIKDDSGEWIPGTKIMTVKIDLSNSNPETCCAYADDAEGMTAGDSSWDKFFGHYPCLLKNGSENGKLNPDNFGQFEDGSTADITSGDAGDVMIAFPRLGVKISTSGSILTVSMTNDPNADGFTYYAHTKGSTDLDVFYMGAYKGYESGSKLRSLSGKTPTVNKTIGAFRTLAEANGSGYEQTGFYQLTFIQCMYILKYKNLNCQSAVGRGCTGGSAAVNTGATNTKGMDFGSTSGTDQCKLFGLEDFWGNVYEWIDGLFCDSSRNILTATDGFNDTGSGYINNGSGGSSNIGGWLSKPQGNSECGFIAKEVSGSSTTYFSDGAGLSASYLPIFGGYWSDGDSAGVFRLIVGSSASTASSNLGARLMFR